MFFRWYRVLVEETEERLGGSFVANFAVLVVVLSGALSKDSQVSRYGPRGVKNRARKTLQNEFRRWSGVKNPTDDRARIAPAQKAQRRR